ncbi:fasciclin domain-containing protein [Maribacter algicola]|uniref:Fasciclin domain-containing protein n=1 Tax=Maribacter algicola TaxID=2498892 RepID=A0A3R8R051_9FLAO|nr:fasciclin domain-containing protein [Maribacter algicola]RRQ49014.1 fasciclin domain-containing protein [Maribacter algicola]
MKNWTSPVSFAVVLFSLLCTAQKSQSDAHDNLISNVSPKLNSILHSTEKTESHSMLLSILKASDLDCLLDYDGQFTVFAPSNAAFEKLSEVTNEWLINPDNKEKLKAIMSYHIIAGNISASKMLRAMCRGNGEASFTTILGEKITATMNGIDIVLTDPKGNQAKIVNADSKQLNGVIHEIDSVFFPLSLF